MLAEIASTFEETGEIVDPHTAVGLAAARQLAAGSDVPVVSLSTAHPAKFPDAVKKAVGVEPRLPPHMADLHERAERLDVLPAAADAVRAFIETKATVGS